MNPIEAPRLPHKFLEAMRPRRKEYVRYSSVDFPTVEELETPVSVLDFQLHDPEEFSDSCFEMQCLMEVEPRFSMSGLHA